MKGSERDDTPVLITEAAPSNDDQLAARKRRYLITMSLRFPCLILAGIFINTWWLAVVLVAVSVPLPWVAVLLANDRPARKSENMHRYRPTRLVPELESREHPVIDG
ncbi:MAG TPA: DUF3099 domain-containing protein [Pseudonocardiaceae bacterium]|nr:DUF3099 domain-containing protein [Pseudonocardiaceae bacterium]